MDDKLPNDNTKQLDISYWAGRSFMESPPKLGLKDLPERYQSKKFIPQGLENILGTLKDSWLMAIT